MNKAVGEKQWVIPDGYIPPESSGSLLSHESICVLNCSTEDATLSISIYFEDRDPMLNIPYVLPGQRTKHIRTSSLELNGEYIPTGVPYAIYLEMENIHSENIGSMRFHIDRIEKKGLHLAEQVSHSPLQKCQIQLK